jgi:hypothetical protein
MLEELLKRDQLGDKPGTLKAGSSLRSLIS